MVTWRLNPALTRFRGEVDLEYPKRDKASDGTIGDLAHQSGVSDHNPDSDGSVDAWDMDVDLHGTGPALVDVEQLKALFEKHEAAMYWIHDGLIASRSWGWARRPYAGANRHDKHVHWNSRQSHEKSIKPWGVLDMTPDQDKMLKAINARIEALANGTPTVITKWSTVNPGAVEKQWEVGELTQLRKDVDELQARPASPPAVVDQAMLKAGLMDPEFLAAVAKAVNDDSARRMAE